MQEPQLVECWECERMTRRPIAVTIEVRGGHPLHVQLCPSCYRTYYVPLIAEASADGAHRDPPAPTRGTPGARRLSLWTLGAARS
jgi:hypothetical protein